MRSKNTLDVLVFVPLIPAVPVIATWFLPWERLTDKIPKRYLGPYLVYCTFAATYFKMDWWFVGLVFILAAIACIFGWKEFDEPAKPKRKAG